MIFTSIRQSAVMGTLRRPWFCYIRASSIGVHLHLLAQSKTTQNRVRMIICKTFVSIHTPIYKTKENFVFHTNFRRLNGKPFHPAPPMASSNQSALFLTCNLVNGTWYFQKLVWICLVSYLCNQKVVLFERKMNKGVNLYPLSVCHG